MHQRRLWAPVPTSSCVYKRRCRRKSPAGCGRTNHRDALIQQSGGSSKRDDQETEEAAIEHERNYQFHGSRRDSSRKTATKKTGSQSNDSSCLLRALDELVPRSLFANKYIIQNSEVCCETYIRFARHTISGDEVVLKFFADRRQFEKSKEKHRLLNQSSYVCKLMDAIEEKGHFPCLVLERGEKTLEEWLKRPDRTMHDRKNALQHTILGVADMHERNVVHFDLKPNNVAWFAREHKWKLLDLASSVLVGEFSHESTTLCYASPEIVQAAQERLQIPVMTSADMWSVGMIAYEVLTGQQYFGPDPRREDVIALLCSHQELPDLDDLDCEDTSRRFISNLLSLNPKQRITGCKALDHALFRSAISTSAIASGMENMETSDYVRVVVPSPTNLLDSAQAQLLFSFRIECFKRLSNNPHNPLRIGDSCGIAPIAPHHQLKHCPVYILKAEEKNYCMRITLTQSSRTRYFIRDVKERAMKDGASEDELHVVQHEINEAASEIVVLLSPVTSGVSSLQREFVILFETDQVTSSALRLEYRFHCNFLYPVCQGKVETMYHDQK